MGQISLIAAMSRNRIIGVDGELPWHLPEDLAHFRRVTASCPVIMGRVTWESIPERFRPLPGRRNIVVSRNKGLVLVGAEVVHTLDDALDLVDGAPKAFVIGGGQLYELAIALADEIYLTVIDKDVPRGDARFPPFDQDAFVLTSRERQRSEVNHFDFEFLRYRRKLPARAASLLRVDVTAAQARECELQYGDSGLLLDLQVELRRGRLAGSAAGFNQLAKLMTQDYDAEYGLQLTPSQTKRSMLRLSESIARAARPPDKVAGLSV